MPRTLTDQHLHKISDRPTTPANLVELVSSIATVGVLQPVLVEEIGESRRVVAGARRVQAVRVGRLEDPTNPHFLVIPAMVCPGPLSAAEVRTWRLVENLAREDLADGELGAALVWERCELLTSRLAEVNVVVGVDVEAIEDPVKRWRALDRIRVRAGLHHLGAPWEDVLPRLGLQLRVVKAERLVKAFVALPREVSSDMDAHRIALTTRLEFIRFAANGREQAANAIWDALKARQKPGLLRSALHRAEAHGCDPEASVDAAEQAAAAANESRRLQILKGGRDTNHDAHPRLVRTVGIDHLPNVVCALTIIGFALNGTYAAVLTAGAAPDGSPRIHRVACDLPR